MKKLKDFNVIIINLETKIKSVYSTHKSYNAALKKSVYIANTLNQYGIVVDSNLCPTDCYGYKGEKIEGVSL